MEVKFNFSRWLIPLPVLVLSLWPHSAQADASQGLQMVAYQITAIPPVRSDDAYRRCGSETVESINRNFDAQPIAGCATDLFMVHLTGFLTIPEHQTIEIMYATDDGGYIEIGEYGFGSWSDRGCSWSVWTGGDIPAATYPVSAWQYEHGGLACMMLSWKIDGGQWSIVPASAFTMAAPPTTTTSTTTSTTTTTTSTTLPVTTTSTRPVTTSSQSVTTSSQSATLIASSSTVPTTTESSTTTTTTTATTVPPYVEILPIVQETTTTLLSPPPLTTTSTAPATTTSTVPETTTSTVPETTTTTATPIATTVPVTASDNTTAETTTTTSRHVSTTTLPDTVPATTVLDDVISAADIAALAVAVIEIASATPETVTVEQITAVIESAAFDMITDDQLAEIADVISDANDAVKDVFESSVNVFENDAMSGYVPKGSTISVAERRVVTGVIIVSFVLPAPIPTISSSSASRRKRLH